MTHLNRLAAVSSKILWAGFLACAISASAEDHESQESIESILQSFVDDFAHDDFARPMTFGFEVDGERWHMMVEGDEERGAVTSLQEGFPEHPILYWEFSSETLRRLDAGMNGETATSRARADDPYPLRTRATSGFPRYALNEDLNAFLEALRLHFWTRGRPEILELATEHARQSHGGNVIGLVYTEGMRSVWYQVMPGQRVNEDPEEQVNPFDSLVITTKGRLHARFNGEERVIEANHAVLIPAGMTHEFWNDGDSPCEGVLILYGEGA